MDLIDRFKLTAENQVLKYAVSKQMFCSLDGCHKILDYRKAVIIEFTSGSVIVMCEECFNKPVTQHILDMNISKSVIKNIQKYHDIAKMEKEEQKKIEAEKMQLKLDLFDSTSKN